MRAYLTFVFLVVSVAAAPSFKSLPYNWKSCKRNDPKLGECLRDAVNVAIVDLASKGAKEFGVFPIDPLAISVLDIDQGSGPVSIELHFKELQINGLKNARVGTLAADVENYRFAAPLETIPELTLIGNYKINGKVLVLPINGEGKCELKLTKVDAEVVLEGKEAKRDGQTFLDVQNFKFNISPENLHMKFENLFNGNKQLSDQMNTFLNENWAEILKELQPSIQQAFGSAFAEISRRIFRKVPLNKVFV